MSPRAYRLLLLAEVIDKRTIPLKFSFVNADGVQSQVAFSCSLQEKLRKRASA